MNFNSISYIALILLVTSVLSETACPSPTLRYRLKRWYKSQSQQETIQIWKNNTLDGTLVYSFNGKSMENEFIEYALCLEPEEHVLVAIDSSNDGWSYESYFELATQTGFVILKGTLEEYSRKEFRFLSSFAQSTTDSWKYTNQQIDENWYQPDYDDVLWKIGRPSEFPSPSTITTYYRTTVLLPNDLSLYTIFETGIYTNVGAIIYVNGERVFTYHLPDGKIDSSTYATEKDQEEHYIRVTGSLQGSEFEKTDTVTIAVEIHQTNELNTQDHFNGFFITILGPDNYRMIGGIGSTSQKDPIQSHTLDKLFDFNLETTFICTSLPCTVDYTFTNKREFINSYTLSFGTDTSKIPTSWILYGSNNQMNYVIIDSKSNFIYTNTQKSFITINLLSKQQAYQTYRIEFLTVLLGTELELAQLEYHVTNIPPQTPKLEYSNSDLVFYKYMDRVYEIPKYNGYTNFEITPNLPSGIVMNVETGIIYGTITTLQEKTSYTISATYGKEGEKTQITIMISFLICSLPSIHLSLEKYNSKSGNGHIEQFQLYSSDHTLLLDSTGIQNASKEVIIQQYHFCIPQGLYTIESYSTTSSGWSINNYINVLLYREADSTILSKYTLWNSDKETFTFNTKFEELVSIHTAYNSTTIDNNWTSPTFDDSNWSIYTPSNTNVSTKGPVYLRIRFNVNVPTGAQSYQFYYRARAGSVLYLDGNELYRLHVPSGPITSSTLATFSESESIQSPWRYSTNVITTLNNGSHVFSVILIPKTANTLIFDFDTYLQLSFTSNINTRTLQIDSESSSYNEGTPASNAFDFNMYTVWSTTIDNEHPAPQYIIGKYTHSSLEVINKYCIGSHWNNKNVNPTHWTFEGSIDGEQWTLLDTQIDMEFTRFSDHLCYYLMNQNTAYNQYKLNCYEVSSGSLLAIPELHLYTVDYSSITIPKLQYTRDSILGYINITLSSGIPTSDYYHNFTITPSLPKGLKLSQGNGVISGLPLEAKTELYTISAYGPDNQLNTITINISIIECQKPFVPVTLFFENMNYDSSHNGFNLLDSKGVSIDKIDQFSATIDTWYSTYCLEPTLYSLLLLDDSNDGWGTGKVTILFNTDYIIETTTCRYGESPKTINLNTYYNIYPGYNDYKYYAYNSTEIPDPTWYKVEFDDDEWPSATPGHFENLIGVTQYYRAYFFITDKSIYSAYNVMINVRGGLAVYINGIFVYKVNLPDTWNPYTHAINEFLQPTHVYMSGSIDSIHLVNGQNNIAFEIHSFSESIETTFDSSLLFSLDNSQRSVDGLYSSSIPGYQDESRIETVDKAFDGSITTKYYAPTCDGEISVSLTYKNMRAEYITSFAFTRGNSKNKVPNYLKLLGSNDKETYDILYQSNDIVFGPYGSVNGTQRFKFYNDKSYNTYKLIMDSSSCTDGIEASEIEFFTDIIGIYCKGDFGYPSVLDQQISYKDCAEYFHGYYYKVCDNGTLSQENDLCFVNIPQPIQYAKPYYTFQYGIYNTTERPIVPAAGYKVTISPSLPLGLSIGLRTGIISGTLQGDCTSLLYTVYVSNSAGKSENTFYMNCIPKEPMNGWMIFVYCILGFLILLLIGFVGIYFYKRRSSVQKKTIHSNKVKASKDAKTARLVSPIEVETP